MRVNHSAADLVRLDLAAALAIFLVTTAAVIYQVYARAQEQTTESAEPGTQPLAFSHRVHAGDYEIRCQYCHAYARRGPVAGIPSVQQCIGCHRTIAVEQPEIVKLTEYWEQRNPIPWIRVHDLPNYVRFTHRRHLQADVECQVCHGQVQQMESAVQVAPLTMGWCVTCHEEREVSKDCLLCHY